MNSAQYRQRSIKYLLICFLAVIHIPLLASSIKLQNYSNQAIWLYIKKIGALGIDWTVKDYQAKIDPGQTIFESGNITGIWALPFNRNLTLPQFKNTMKKELKNSENLEKVLRKKAQEQNLYARFGKKNNTNWNMSFDIATTNKPYLYFGTLKLYEPFTILTTSDKHVIAKSTADLMAMSMEHYGGEQARQSRLETFMKYTALRDQMLSYLENTQHNVQAVLYAGDMAGNYGKKSETEGFKAVWWDPVQKILYPRGGNIFTGIGNHDNYWSSIGEQYPTHSLRFVEDTYGNYLYAYNIGQYRLIHLALRPTPNLNQFSSMSKHPLKTHIPSLTFLANELKKVGNDPVILMFHYPVQGKFSDWWSKAEKDQFYETIKKYNIAVIIVGHSHKMAVYKFRNKCLVVKAGGAEFAVLTFDPTNPAAVGIKFINKDGNAKPYKVDTISPEKDRNPAIKEAED